MRRVVLKYSALSVLMHAYFLRIVHLAFPSQRWVLLVAGVFCVMMLTASLLSRVLAHFGSFRAARVMSFIALPWTVVLMWLCTLALGMDLWNFGVSHSGRVSHTLAAMTLPPQPTFLFFAVIVTLACAWSLYEAANVQIERVTLKSSRVTGRIRIMQISDLHLGLTNRERFLQRVMGLVAQACPDVVVSTGDMVDGAFKNVQPLARLFRQVQPRFGKYAILGNHEYFSGVEGSLDFMKQAGFTVLRGESVELPRQLRLTGVDDTAGHRMGAECHSDEDAALPPEPDGRMTVLLKHRPKIGKLSRGRFDLQLSGHTHGGQISADRFVMLAYPLRLGLRQIDEDSHAYVSRGAGTWGPPMRLFSPPEVTLITIEPA